MFHEFLGMFFRIEELLFFQLIKKTEFESYYIEFHFRNGSTTRVGVGRNEIVAHENLNKLNGLLEENRTY